MNAHDELRVENAIERDIEDDGPEDDWFEDDEGFVKAPLSFENPEGDPNLNGAFDRW